MRPMSTPDDTRTPELIEALADGWTIHVRGDVSDDGGYSGGHTSSSVGVLATPGTTVEEMIAAIDARRAADELDAVTPRELRVLLTRGDVGVVVMEESKLPSEGPATVLWPPTVVPGGVVLRWHRTTVHFELASKRPVGPNQAPRQEGTEAQAGLLVTADGEVHDLPFELAVSPLTATADGRLLMPSSDPLWWDGEDEPLTLLSLAGEREAFLIAGAPVTPSRVLRSIGEEFRNTAGAHGIDEPLADAKPNAPFWRFRQARVDGERLRLRLSAEHRESDVVGWVAVDIPLQGSWAVRRIATGDVGPGEPLPPL